MPIIKYNLFALKHQLESHTGRSYPWTKVSKDSGIHLNTIKNLAGNKTGRADLENLAKLIVFFRNEGMPVTLCDLFAVTESTEPSKQ